MRAAYPTYSAYSAYLISPWLQKTGNRSHLGEVGKLTERVKINIIGMNHHHRTSLWFVITK